MQIKLTIPEPCHEDWAKMTPTEQGKFCGSCQKEVFDMTSASEDEAAKKIHHSTGELCVRIPNDYLNKKIDLHAAGFGKYGKLGAVGAIISAAAFTPIISSSDADLSELAEKNTIQLDALQPLNISGTVVNEKGEVINNVQVTIEQNNHKATMTSLTNGRFSFQLDPMKIKNGMAKIRLEKAGFISLEKEISIDGNLLNGKFVMNVHPKVLKTCALKPLAPETVELDELQIVTQTLGQVTIQETVTVERQYMTAGAMVSHVYINEITPIPETEKQEIEEVKMNVDIEPVDINTIAIYPNPTTDFANIELKKAGNYTLYVFDINGKMIQTSSFTTNKKQVDLSKFERGNYIVKIIDNDTHESLDGKVVLMR